MISPAHVCKADHGFYQLHIILTALIHVDLINVASCMCFYQVIMTLHFLNDVINDVESTQKMIITS